MIISAGVDTSHQFHNGKNVFVPVGVCMTSISTQNPSLAFMDNQIFRQTLAWRKASAVSAFPVLPALFSQVNFLEDFPYAACVIF